MSLMNRLEIIDRNGWRKVAVLDKPLVYIGSDPGRDIYLEPSRGAGVSALHAQMIFSNASSGSRLVNLSNTAIPIGQAGGQMHNLTATLAPHESILLPDQTTFQIGEYTLILQSEVDGLALTTGSGFATGTGKNISIGVSLPFTHLEPGRILNGTVKVRNLGDQGGVQIDLDIEGFDPGCYSIEPGPILSTGSEKEVEFRIYHRGSQPTAGLHPFTVRAAALRAYSGEEVTVTQTIQVSPSYAYKMRLFSPGEAAPEQAKPAAKATRPVSTYSPITAPTGKATLAPGVPAASRKAHPYQEIWEAAQTQDAAPPPTPTPAGVELTTAPLPPAEPKAPAAAPPPARPWLGVQSMPLNDAIVQAMNLPEKQRGLLILDTLPGSPAEHAGLRGSDEPLQVEGYSLRAGGDILVAWNDLPVGTIEELQTLLAQAAAGQVVQITILHRGQAQKIAVTLGDARQAPAMPPVQILTAPAERPKESTLPPPVTPTPPTQQTAAPTPAAPPESLPTVEPAPETPVSAEPAPPAAELPPPPRRRERATRATARPAPKAAAKPIPAAQLTADEETPAPEAKPEPPAAEPPASEDWWAPAPAVQTGAASPVLKMKAATPAAPAEIRSKSAGKLISAPKPAKPKAPSDEDWWGQSARSLADSAQVIQLKARPEEEAESADEEKP